MSGQYRSGNGKQESERGGECRGTRKAKNATAPMTLVQVRQELKGVKGKRYWRSVDELADTAEFQAAVEREFPPRRRSGSIRFRGAAL
jgi:MoCo/4Fe-4S cofactor protein with predicted Tat translocation signal